jgi:ATP-binding cassette subfamily F protein 3
LQQALVDFPGSLILVSHDVDFLNLIVNKVVDIRKGELKIYDDGIEYYLDKRKEQAESEKKIVANKKTDSENASRKEQKRLEAENRQRKYKATKSLISDIDNLEKEIAELENKEKELEKTLADEKIYADTEKTKDVTFEYKGVKEKLNYKLAEWSRLSEKLQNIEDQFS